MRSARCTRAVILRCPRAACAALFVALLLPTASAHAWTRTSVESLRAHADVDARGHARITLEVGIAIEGGWLSRFELKGLGEDSTLDAVKPPVLYAEPDIKHAALAELLPEGDLILDFGDKRSAPWRGHYVLRASYETTLTRRGEHAHAVLTLPAFASSLEGVELWIDAPRGTSLVRAPELETEQHRAFDRGQLTVLHVQRPQLPRTQALEVELALPAPKVAVTAVRKAASTPLQLDPKTLGLGLLTLAFATVRRREEARAQLTRVELLTMRSALLRASAALTLCVLAALTRGAVPSLSLVLLMLVVLLSVPLRLTARLPASAVGSFQHARRAAAHAIDIQRAKRQQRLLCFGPASALDATTPVGACALALCAFAALLSPDGLFLEAFCVLSPLMLTGTRWHRPPNASDAIAALHAQESSLRTVAAQYAEISLRVRRETPTAWARDPELRVRAARAPEGLVSLGLLLSRASGGRATFVWSACTQAGSPASEVLARAWPYAQPEAGAWLVPAAAPAEELARLLEWLKSASPRVERARPARARAA